MIDCTVTANYLKEKGRITGGCTVLCSNCLFSRLKEEENSDSCIDLETVHTAKTIQAVQEWSNSHPLTTYLSDFLKKYPNAILERIGTPEICIEALGYGEKICCREDINYSCVKCWNSEYKTEFKEFEQCKDLQV